MALPVLIPLCGTDAGRLWDLDQRCFPAGIAYSRGEIVSLLRAGTRGYHRSIEVDGKLAAFILTLSRQRRGHVITVDVAEEYRRRKLGLALMQAAEEHYRKLGLAGMRLEVAVNNTGALRFYSRLGYRVRRNLPGYYADDLDGLRLEKDFGHLAVNGDG